MYGYDLQRMMQFICLSRYIPFTDDFVQVVLELNGTHVSTEDLDDYAVPAGLFV